MSNFWRMTLEQEDGQVIQMQEPIDPYAELIKKNGGSTVGCTYKLALQDFGKESLSFHVSLTCDQDAPTIERAGQMAFTKVIELVGRGTAYLDQMRAMAEKQREEAAERMMRNGY